MTEAEKLLAELPDEEILEDEEVFLPVEGYDSAPYSDENIISISNKSIGNMSSQIVVSGESYSQYVAFERDRYMDGIDLTQKLIQIHYERQDGVGDNSPAVNVTASDTKIRYGWIIPDKACILDGVLKVMPFAYGTQDGRIYVQKELYAELKINNGLSIDGGIEEPSEEWYTQFLEKMGTYLSQVQQAKNEVFAMAQEVQNSRESVEQAEANVEKIEQTIRDDSEQALASVADLRAYLGLSGEDVLGIQVDYKNGRFTRIASAASLTAGADFDRFSMFGGRKRCNVADDGTIVAWHGDADYAEDGSMGQVMVYQPKFYYLVYPVSYEPIDTGIGYHLRKANYYVSEKPHAGFKLHPAFYDAAGDEVDYYLTSAYEGSIWDADGGDGTGTYLMNDEQVMNVSSDKFCSVAGAKPASGLTQILMRPNIEQLARNRGAGWHSDLVKQVSAEQMLMVIEMGTMNMQTAITRGVVAFRDDDINNCSSLTGSTANIGNGTGKAEQTVNEKGGTTTTETANGKTAVCYRGKENFWGNIWKFVYGINVWGNGAMGGGQPYICTDFNFAESKNSGNYEGAGFTLPNEKGYISAMGYGKYDYDWLFLPSECLGDSSSPVGDYIQIITNLNGYRIVRFGGRWDGNDTDGAFGWYLNDSTGGRFRAIGGRLVYIPTRDSAAYLAAIESWKQQMKM